MSLAGLEGVGGPRSGSLSDYLGQEAQRMTQVIPLSFNTSRNLSASDLHEAQSV
eukprot:m.6908 g.6908  ORF g.6908 m.6908 type:complete len:54 (-) comp8539_c0_seq1:124-285(-)